MKKRNILILGTSLLTIAGSAATVISCVDPEKPKPIPPTPIAELTKEEVEKQTTIALENKDEIFTPTVENVTKRIKITSAPKDWEIKIDKVEVENNTAKITLKATKKDTTYTFTKNLTLNIAYDKFLKTTIKDTNDEIVKPEDLKNHFTDEFGFDSIVLNSTNSNYVYELDSFDTASEKGEIILSIILKDKDDNEIAKFQKTISGFKSKLPEDENDADIAIKNLPASQYNTKNAGDIKEEDIEFSSKSDKYKYKLVGLEANDADGELVINYKQFQKDDTFIAQHQKILEGFKKITEADLNDIEEIFEGVDKSEYPNYLPTDIIKKHYRVKSKSWKYDYKIEEVVANDTAGIVTFKLKWAIRNGVYSKDTISYVVSGFKKS